MIDYREISVVIQGALTSDTYREDRWIEISCKSVRRYLPGAEIIVSTWRDADTEGIDFDTLVLNNDPGHLFSFYEGAEGGKTINNINRQIISTINGLKKATRRYAMKLRSDSCLKNADFLKYYDRYGKREGGSGPEIMTFEPRNPWGIFSGQFCLCDFWFFGVREAMLELWDISLYSPQEAFEKDLLGEEYIYKKYEEKKKKHLNEVNADKFLMYREIIKIHFIIIPAGRSGIKSFKYPSLNNFCVVNIKHYVLSHSDWLCFAYGDRRRNMKARIAAYMQKCSGNFFLLIKDKLYGKKNGNTIRRN